MKFKFIFAWYDFWVGLFFDRAKSWLYVFPLPMVGFIIKFPQRRYWLVSNVDPSLVIGSTIKSELEHCTGEDNVHSRPYWAVNGELRPVFGVDHHTEMIFGDTFYSTDDDELPW